MNTIAISIRQSTRALIAIAIFLLLQAMASADTPSSFRAAKKIASQVYFDHKETFYCGCDFKWKGKKGTGEPDLKSCGMGCANN
jgi:deoxyribonuclease-1